LNDTTQDNKYLVPTKFIPYKGQIVSNFERAVFIKHSQFTATTRSTCQPYDNRILLVFPGFKEKVEHPAHKQFVYTLSKSQGQLENIIKQLMEYELLSSMRVLNGIISSTMSQVINGNSFIVFDGEVWKPKRLLNDVLILLHIGFGVENVDIMRREEVEVSN